MLGRRYITVMQMFCVYWYIPSSYLKTGNVLDVPCLALDRTLVCCANVKYQYLIQGELHSLLIYVCTILTRFEIFNEDISIIYIIQIIPFEQNHY